jgi:hypothetical protein
MGVRAKSSTRVVAGGIVHWEVRAVEPPAVCACHEGSAQRLGWRKYSSSAIREDEAEGSGGE